MELRNYANECYMRVRRNDLRKDIENGYISHEQANQYLAEYAYELKYPDKKPDKTVIRLDADRSAGVHLTGISAGRMRMALAMILVEFVIRNAISTYQ